MSCIYCFFRDEKQYSLKIRSRKNISRFEKDLRQYKEDFLEELRNLVSCKVCSANHDFINNEGVMSFLEEMREDLQSKTNFIAAVFEEIISVYVGFISRNHEDAYCKLKFFLEKYSTNYTSINTQQLCKPMFRIRSKSNDYDETDIKEYFHIPFTKRYLAGNQRYSMTGQPMSYMAESLQIALKEINKTIDQVNVALFYPRYSYFYNEGMYDVTNGIITNLNSLILQTYADSAMPNYDNSYYTFSKNNMNKMIADYILYQILQYPTKEETKGVFIQEYVLPQLMMEVVQNRGSWLGLQYQTSKQLKYEKIKECGRLPNLNYCFLIPYTTDSAYNEEYLKKFFYEIYFEGEDAISLEGIKEKIQECYSHCRETQNEGFIVQEYFHYIVNIEMYLDWLIGINEEEYVQDKVFQVEVKLFYKFLNQIDEIICNPVKYQVMKKDDYI